MANDGARIDANEVTIVVGEENQPPVVNSGPDTDVELPNTILTMSRSVTDDGLPPGAPLDSYSTQISGPAVVSYVSRSNPTTIVTFPVAGPYILSLDGRSFRRLTRR